MNNGTKKKTKRKGCTTSSTGMNKVKGFRKKVKEKQDLICVSQLLSRIEKTEEKVIFVKM